MDSIDIHEFRESVIKTFPDNPSVYVLGDFFGAPLYVGMSVVDSRDRPRRHTTSARSDIIANRYVSVAEIAYVDLYIPEDISDLIKLEKERLYTLNNHRPLFNTKIPKLCPDVTVPAAIRYQLLPDSEITRMQFRTNTMLHQTNQLHRLMEYIHEAKNNVATRRALATRNNLFQYHLERYLNDAA
jgi:hypothetical protein